MADVTDADLDAFIALALTVGAYSCDVEHPPHLGPHGKGFRLAGCSFGTRGQAMYLQNPERIKYVCDRLFARDVDCVGHNFKYDMICLRKAGIVGDYDMPLRVADTMIGMNMLDDNRRPNQLGLKGLILELFGHTMMDFQTAWSYGERSKEFVAYALDDAHWEYKLWEWMKPRLTAENLLKPFLSIPCAVSEVLVDVEIEGLKWGLAGARRLLAGFQKLRDSMEKEIKQELGEINLGSGDQLAKRLFTDLGYSSRGIEMTKSGSRLSVDAAAMDVLAPKYPICQKIKTYRTAEKMINTYIEPLSRWAMDDERGRVHPTYWLVSSTGRTRCEKPNFQNIPAFLDKMFSHLNLRKNIIPDEGRTMVVADLSQIELRLCAHVTQDARLLRAYREWTCTVCGEKGSANIIQHKCPKCGAKEDENILKSCPTCKKKHVKYDKKTNRCACCEGARHEDVMVRGFWHGLDLHTQTTDAVPALGGDRQNGKAANFALIYCATARRMNQEHPTLSIAGWQAVIDQFFDFYPGVRRWHLMMERLMWSEGENRDIFGRKRRIPRKDIEHNTKHALNQIVNSAVQGPACEYIELCMVELRQKFMASKEWMKSVWMVNFVHDELDFEINHDRVTEYLPMIQESLERRVEFSVPIRAVLSVADSWGAAK